MNTVLRLLVLLAICGSASQLWAQYPASCDTRKECVGQAVSLTVTTGRSQHFIELAKNPIKMRQTALTFELWAKIDKQAGQRQYVGGLWGPNSDFNDVFVLYIDQNDQLTFEVNGDDGPLQSVDNTIVRTDASTLYGAWHHYAAVFDGTTQSVSIYVDGVLAGGPVRNSAHPANYLRPLDRGDLPLLIGSFNGVADNATVNRTLKGMVDEIRIWERALDSATIFCQKDRSLNGNETGLRVYLRCNESVNNITSCCDATGNAHTGLLRSGASNQRSDRAVPRTLSVVPPSIKDTVKCDSVTSWTFTINDAAPCGSSASLVMRGPDASKFKVNPASVNLVPGVPVTVTLTYTGTNVGQFTDTLEIRPTNRCGLPNTQVRLDLVRITETGVTRGSLTFDTLWVGCVDKTYIDSTFEICNTSDLVGQPRTLTIQSVLAKEPKSYQVVGVTWPILLPPGKCTTLVVRSFVRDTTADYLDTLEIKTDDRCQRTPIRMPIIGRTQEVISIRNPGGTRRIDTMRFEATCPGLLSAPQNYVWQNLTLTPMQIDTVIVPKDFTHYRIRFPAILQPKTGQSPIAVRFLPRQPGVVFDSIVIKTSIQGCKIEKKIYVTGRGLDNKVEWSINGLLDFGNVIVGQQKTMQVRARNNSKYDALNVALYVERGEAFALLGGTGRTIQPGDSVLIPITFRPTDSLDYIDKLCLFETRCYTVDCIELKGKGVLETFRFQPLVMETQNVISCQTRDDSVFVVNMTNSARTIDSMRFVDQSGGRLQIIDPPGGIDGKTFAIPARDSLRIRTRYTPNDPSRDRADRAYIRFRDQTRAEWQVQLIGTSVAPKIFITQLTAFGVVEAGDVKRQQLILENTSSLPVRVDSLTIGAGFTIISTSRALPLTLQPRDSIRIEIEFRPTAAMDYAADITAYSSDPCTVVGKGRITGRGVIIKLESALSLVNFGYTRPCECIERTIEMLNGSLRFDMTIDSIWIDSVGVPGGKPQFYTWKSRFSPNGTTPYKVPPGERDTVYITFCPRTPADSTQMECRAAMHIKAFGSQWSNTLETFLIGKRALSFRPTPTSRQFPYGVIDVLSPAALSVVLKIPDFRLNPTQDQVVIDSITFEPNDRVFFITAPTTFPQVVNPGDSLVVQFRQRPRAPKDYRARMKFWFSKPCTGWDTTVLVRGGGFAQTKGLQFTFDPKRALPDTFAMISCDTLAVPLYSSIVIDATVVDITTRVDFDSTQLRLLDITSPLTGNQCTSTTGGVKFGPSIITAPSPYGGLSVKLKNFCGIDSITPFATMRFVTLNNNRANSKLTIDSINFDTEDVILYRLIASGDKGTIIALKSDINISQPVQFDSVRILECADRTLTVVNTGDVPNAVNQLLDLPRYTTIFSSTPPIGDSVQPGDSAVVTLRFCPRSEEGIDTNVTVVSAYPCDVRDTTSVAGFGYAPEFAVGMLPTQKFFISDTIRGGIGDTIDVPVMIDKDISATYGGVEYFLNGLNYDVSVKYAPRSLKYIGPSFLSKPTRMTVTESSLGSVDIAVRQADTTRSGPIATLRFVVAVPEVSQTDVMVENSGFLSDSIQFLDILPQGGTSPFVTSGKCNISVVKFASVGKPRLSVHPQPAIDNAVVTFRMQETVPVMLEIIDSRGSTVETMLDGSITLSGGEYALKINTANYPAGLYFVRISAGVFSSTSSLMISK
ncbi:MAG: choice-of-anchor D domain-containing protein [Ignavibacteria bacterium]